MTTKPKKPVAKKPAAKKPTFEECVKKWLEAVLDGKYADTLDEGWKPLSSVQHGDELRSPAGVYIVQDDYGTGIERGRAFKVTVRAERDGEQVHVWAGVTAEGKVSRVLVREALAQDPQGKPDDYERFGAVAQKVRVRRRPRK